MVNVGAVIAVVSSGWVTVCSAGYTQLAMTSGSVVGEHGEKSIVPRIIIFTVTKE